MKPSQVEPIDLCIPIYLNQQIVFDLLAVLDDGFSQISVIKTSASESETNNYGMGASIGASNVFALLGMSFSGERGKDKGSQEQTEVSQEKVHTPTSLFAKLRNKLTELRLLKHVNTVEDLDGLTCGQFVEFTALLRKNPLIEALEGIKQLVEMAEVLQERAGTPAGQKQKGARPQGQSQSAYAYAKQVDGLLTALVQSNSLELIGQLPEAAEIQSVLATRLDFFSFGGTSEIIGGEYRVLGKAVRVIRPNTDDSINLLRKTPLGILDPNVLDQLAQALRSINEAGMNFPKLVTRIEGPSLLVIPIAIFT